MVTYRVKYEIDIDADSPRDAAEAVEQILKDPDSQRPVLDVWDGVKECRIDLSDESGEIVDWVLRLPDRQQRSVLQGIIQRLCAVDNIEFCVSSKENAGLYGGDGSKLEATK